MDFDFFGFEDERKKHLQSFLETVTLDDLSPNPTGPQIVFYWHPLTDMLDYSAFKEKHFKEVKDNKFTFEKNKVYIHLTSLNVLDSSISKLFFRSLRYLDSSIWHYLYSFEQLYYEPKDETHGILRIIKEIKENFQLGKYQLAVAEEYRELQNRIFQQDYLEEVNGHANYVSPYLFHSENEMRSKLVDINRRNDSSGEIPNYLHDCNWRILLVDDHSKSDMASGELGKTVRLNKHGIIEADLRLVRVNTNQNNGLSTNKSIKFDCVSSVQEAEEKLKNKNKYDIILLDYKLNVQNGKQEYGYELLEKIRDNQEEMNNQCGVKKLNPGPNETFYFMFISAYTTAVQERLQMEGFYVSKDYWFIGRGACPTNTPYLFLYSLKRMMDIRYDKLTKHSKQLLKDLAKGSGNINDKKIDEEKGKYATMTMFLTKLYEEGKERNNCVIGFNAFLNLRRVYDVIKHDVDHDKQHSDDEQYKRSSPLIMSLFKDEAFCSNSFWEHLQNLVYLTAFGTIRQWPEMWEDYMFIKGKLVQAENKLITDAKDNNEEHTQESNNNKKQNENIPILTEDTKPSVLIRNYILSLKNMMS